MKFSMKIRYFSSKKITKNIFVKTTIENCTIDLSDKITFLILKKLKLIFKSLLPPENWLYI